MATLTGDFFMAQSPFLTWPRKKSVKIIQTAEKIFQNKIPQNKKKVTVEVKIIEIRNMN